MLLYMAWLLLPALQTALHAITGIAAVGLFGVAVLLDGETLPRRWRDFLPRVFLMAALPVILFTLLERGGGNFAGYYAQQGMFWFPLLWCAYARRQGDSRLYRFVKPLLLALMVITTLTTVGWLAQGMLRGGKVYAYARSLGSGEPNREAYLKELMLRNIGGYDFIYASVLALPIVFYAATASHGWKRLGYSAFLVLQLGMIGLSQYTYAILFSAGIVAVEGLALVFRIVWKKLSVAASMLWTLPVFAALWLARVPLLGWAGNLAAGFGFENAAYSLTQLLTLLTGGAVDAGSRLITYAKPLTGILASPWVGSLLGGAKWLGMHSDLLDLLSALGILGTAAFGMGAWLIGRGSVRGVRALAAYPHIVLQWLGFLLCMGLGTVFYSREIPLILCLSATFLLRAQWEEPSGAKASKPA